MRHFLPKFFVFAGIFFFYFQVQGQNLSVNKDYTIYLQNHTIPQNVGVEERFSHGELAKLFGISAEELKLRLSNLDMLYPQMGPESFGGKYYRLMQFREIPSVQLRNSLEARGIVLLDYIPNYTYIVSVPVGISEALLTYDENSDSFIDFRTLPILPEYKIRQSLNELPLPAWAIKETGTIDLNISWFKDLNASEVKAALEKLSYRIITSNDYGHYLTLRTSPVEIANLAALPFVSFVEPIAPEAKPENYTGRTLHRSNAIASDYATGRHYDGTGVVVAMGDDGPIGPHIDYQGRVDNSRVTTNTGNHGDHVGGTIMGAGNLNPLNKGMAFGATLEVFDVWDAVNESPTSIVTDSVVITSTSYSDGCNAGYTSSARTADEITRENPKLIHIFSAGNDGESDCGYGAGPDWGNITGGIKIGKNVIQVANLTQNGNAASSSSRGPSEDGRLMPLIAAKGTDVTSTIDPNDYAVFSGTSMACPGVSGTLAQINQAYRELNGGQWPQSGLIKAILLNTAEDLGNPGPDFIYGFGHMNALRAVKCIEDMRYLSDSLAQGETDQFTLNVPPGTAEIRIMAYWHDYEAANMASVVLVNNLKLEVTDPNSVVFNPWILDPTPVVANLDADAVRGVDNLNNQEQVTIENPVAGTYTLDISGFMVPQGPQEYFIVYEIIDSSITVTRPIGGEGLKPNEPEIIRWDASGDYGTFNVEYSLDSGSSWNVISASVNGNLRNLNWTVPGTVTGKALIKISRNGIEDKSDSTFSIMPVPGGLQIFRACPNSITLKWNLLSLGTSYDVYQLGVKYMDSIGTTTADTFVVTGVNQFSEYWFAVSSNGADDANGRRCNAIEKTPGVFSCLEPNDVAVTNVVIPTTGIVQDCSSPGSLQVKIELTNFSPNTLTNVPVNYKINNGATVSETFTGSLTGFGTAYHTFAVSENFSAGTYSISAWASFAADANHLNDSIVSGTQFVTGSLVTLPYQEDFQSFTICSSSSNCEATVCNLANGWINSNVSGADDIDWRTHSGATTSVLTGPDADHTLGTTSGKFLYLEASSCFGKKAEMLSPCIDLGSASSPTLSYWMHLFGSEMGELHLDIFSNGTWTNDIIPVSNSDWGNFWWKKIVDLSPWIGEVVVLRWRGITGSGATSDMAIDDIYISPTVVGLNEAVIQPPFNIFPVPGDGLFTFQAVEWMGTEINFRVMDMLGREMEKPWNVFLAGDFTTQIDVRHLPSGIYFLEAWNKTGKWTSRLVIQ